MLPCELQLHEEKSEHIGLPQQNGFWPSNVALFAEAGKRT
jgi:hypothetical protein